MCAGDVLLELQRSKGVLVGRSGNYLDRLTSRGPFQPKPFYDSSTFQLLSTLLESILVYLRLFQHGSDSIQINGAPGADPDPYRLNLGT